jgi:ABC-type amino acid transport substrate-binding protein
MLKIICAAALILGGSAAGLTQAALAQGSATPDVVKDLAPTGKLRAAINVTNRVLAQEDPAAGDPRGVSVDLARELAKRLGVPVELIVFRGAGTVFEPNSERPPPRRRGSSGAWGSPPPQIGRAHV